MQWTRSEWLSFKLAMVDKMKGFMKTTPAPQEKKAKTKIPAYDPEEDALYDFTEEEAVNEDDLFDLDELESIKLDNE